MICVRTASGNKCRNPLCYGVEDCLCYSTLVTPTPLIPTAPPYIPPDIPTATPEPPPIDYTDYTPIFAPTSRRQEPSPTPYSMLLAEALTPTPMLLPLLSTITSPILTIDPFYDAKKQTNPMIALAGTSDPGAELEISITPDSVSSVVTSDTLGNWSYIVPKKLKNGEKQLTVIAQSLNGGQMTKTETFTVVGAFQFPFAAVVFSLLLACGIGGYIFYQKKIAKKKLLKEPYMQTTTPGTSQNPAMPEFQQPEPASTGESMPSQPLEPALSGIDGSSSPVENPNLEKVGLGKIPSPYGFEVPDKMKQPPAAVEKPNEPQTETGIT